MESLSRRFPEYKTSTLTTQPRFSCLADSHVNASSLILVQDGFGRSFVSSPLSSERRREARASGLRSSENQSSRFGNRIPSFEPSPKSNISVFFSPLTADRDRETIEELSAALRDEKARTEQIQLALTNEKRQTEALKHAKERADHLRNVNKGNKRCLVRLRFLFQASFLPCHWDTFPFMVVLRVW